VSNNDMAGQRRAGASESSLNNVIYIGRASFRMEPAPLSDAEMDDGPGEDIRPPMSPSAEYLTADIPFAHDIDMVEVTDEAAALPASEFDDSESMPALRPVRSSRSGIRLSRGRLVVMGALAFSAGILTSAGARTLVKSPRGAHVSAAATATDTTVNVGVANAADDLDRSAPAAAPAPAALPAPAAAPAAAANTAPTPAAAPVAVAEVPAAVPAKAPLALNERTREKASAPRARAFRRGQRRMSESASMVEGEMDGQSKESPAAAGSHDSPNWVDPFAQ
jgi:hypothetical protein